MKTNKSYEYTITLSDYKKMLKYEEQLRKSDLFQGMYMSPDHTEDDSINELAQYLTLEHFGYEPNEENLDKYQLTANRFDKKELDVYWIKYNIYKRPDFKFGDMCPVVNVYDEYEKKYTFPNDFLNDKPLCVLASSSS